MYLVCRALCEVLGVEVSQVRADSALPAEALAAAEEISLDQTRRLVIAGDRSEYLLRRKGMF